VDAKDVYVSTWDACCAWLDQMPAVTTETPSQLVDDMVPRLACWSPAADIRPRDSLPSVIRWPECSIKWKWSSPKGQVAAGWLNEKFCFGTLDHALCKDFLMQANITHVVIVLGAGSRSRSCPSPHLAAMEGRFQGIQYQRWSINHEDSFWACMLYFASWQHTMQAGGVILLHCKSGKDRSAFAAYMYLRLQLDFSDAQALECLSCRTTAAAVSTLAARLQ